MSSIDHGEAGGVGALNKPRQVGPFQLWEQLRAVEKGRRSPLAALQPPAA
ncbi:hypothetical protein ACH4CE_38025 [Streptomyces gelaticus]